jgi:hypothetical protein
MYERNRDSFFDNGGPLSIGGSWCFLADTVAGIRVNPVSGERTAAIVVREGGVAGPTKPVKEYLWYLTHLRSGRPTK